MSRSLIAALLAAGVITAAAGGSYLAVRQNAAPPVAPVATDVPASTSVPGAAVQETEGVIEASPAPEPPPAPALEPEPQPEPPRRAPEPRRRSSPVQRERAPEPRIRASNPPAVNADRVAAPAEPPTATLADPEPVVERAVTAAATATESRTSEPVIEEIVIPASAVVGLEIETTVTSERARIEDRVDASVTRDVFADGRLALPAGSRVIGAVTLVERGGKVRERARLGVRFHTVVLASGRQVPLRTEPIYRDGESPTGDSSRKIGGAAIGGAVLGAILGGGKGAIAGATAGAAGGTAAVMSGDRKPAVLASGSVVTVKLAAPVSFDVERY